MSANSDINLSVAIDLFLESEEVLSSAIVASGQAIKTTTGHDGFKVRDYWLSTIERKCRVQQFHGRVVVEHMLEIGRQPEFFADFLGMALDLVMRAVDEVRVEAIVPSDDEQTELF